MRKLKILILNLSITGKKESVYGRYRVIDEWTHTMRHLSGGDIEITSNYVRDHELSVLLGDQKYTSYTRQIDPFDEIGIILLESNDQELFPGSKVNAVYPIPAIYLPYASDKRIDTDKKKRLFEAIKGVSFAVGVGELVAAKTTVQYVFAFAELSPVIIDEVLTIDPVRNKILSINGGKTFLDVWEDVKVVLQAAVILRGAQLTLKSFITNYDEIKGPLKSKLSPDEFKKIDDEVNQVKKKLENGGEKVDDLVKAIPLDEFVATLRKSISTKIFRNTKYSLILTDDQLSKIIELGNRYKFSSNMIEAIVLAHSRRYSYAKFEDVISLMDLIYKKNINNSFGFNEGYDLLTAYERNEFFILFGSKVDPLDFFTKGYEQSHLSEFRNGVSFFCPQIMIDKYGKLLGRADGVYVIPKYKMDELLKKTNKDIGLIEDELAIPRGSWVNQKMSRVDVDNVQDLNLRLTSGAEEAANVFYIPGGFTANGQKRSRNKRNT
ncbi:MAG: hypothetical protein NVV82_22685 [Sporocytophaga sp.]|nr:hypothetical protein [Sporocytophaga sp.]